MRDFSLTVSAHWPPGEYTAYVVVGALGSYPSDTLAIASLTFIKEAGALSQPDPIAATSEIPEQTFIDQNYPNPFNPSTTIRYGLSEDAHVTLKLYNMLGREVATLVNEFLPAGYKSAVWDGRNSSGSTVSSGMYFYRIEAGSFVSAHRMILLK